MVHLTLPGQECLIKGASSTCRILNIPAFRQYIYLYTPIIKRYTDMPARRKRESTATISLHVEQGFNLPQWFETATASEIGAALSMVAAIMPKLSDTTQVSSHTTSADQLAAHEANLQSTLSEARAQSQAMRDVLQARIAELTTSRDAE